MPVTGIGGFFFRANEPEALSALYQKHLGIDAGSEGWHQSAGPTVVAPFPTSTDYFPAEKQWMLNLRVAGLDALLDELAAAGIAIVKDPEWDTPETGRFARIHDPEGNPIELWEPPPD
jgi:catechol 2,3-dioxygenase-like lactoylglutathione lyase family enzyme